MLHCAQLQCCAMPSCCAYARVPTRTWLLSAVSSQQPAMPCPAGACAGVGARICGCLRS